MNEKYPLTIKNSHPILQPSKSNALSIINQYATIQYAVGKWNKPLATVDLQIDSPYNTRKNLGLPPTPISGFSLSALKAAINPAPSQYWYYLHDKDGNIHFAQTNEEQNQNRWRYLK